HDDRPAVRRQDRPQIAQKAPMRPGTVVACQWIHFLIDRQRATPQGHRCLKHQMLVPRLTVRPVDEEDGAGSLGQYPLRNRSIDGDPFVLQRHVAQQAVDAFDVVFDKSRGLQLPAQICQRQAAADQQAVDHFDQGAQSRLMYGRTSGSQPFMQQSNSGHAASSIAMERVATSIRAGGSMSINPLSSCSSILFRQDSWGALSAQAEAEAEVCFLKAIEIARTQQAKSWELRATESLARLWQQQGKKTEARQMLAEIYGWFTEG